MLAGAALALLAGAPLAAAAGDDAIAEAEAALARGDGVAAELAGKRALDEGAPRSAVAALIGEGELLQGDLGDAREWLDAGGFDARTFERGQRALARLEIADNDLDAAAAAYDAVLQQGRPTAGLWVEIGRLLYRAGGHQGALAAARRAVAMDGDDPAALEFIAQLTRDARGPLAALPLFQQAMRAAPDNPLLAVQYAATLGDAGQHAAMLQVVRAIVEDHPGQPQAFYLQAILAARAGDDDLARQLWWRTEGAFDQTPAGLLVSGVLEYRSGNPALASERFAQLSRLQPLSISAQLLFARALVANGEANAAIPILAPLAARPDASAYSLVLLGRAYEQLGRREDAGRVLDLAAALPPSGGPVYPAIPALWLRDGAGRTRDPDDPVQALRELANTGQLDAARARVAGIMAEVEGSADLQLVAGDIALLEGNAAAAMAQYRQVATIRSNWPLVQRMVAVTGDPAMARRLLADHLRNNPREAQAAALLGRMERTAGNPARAAALLRHAASIGSGPADAFLLGDLAEVEQQLGQTDNAQGHARTAHALFPGNRRLAALALRLQAVN